MAEDVNTKELRQKIADLELQAETLATEPQEEFEPKKRLGNRIASSIGDAMMTYASMARGGPAVQSNLERFLEERLAERKEFKEEQARERQAKVRGLERKIERTAGDVRFAEESERRKAEIASEQEHEIALQGMRDAARAAEGQRDRESREAIAAAELQHRQDQLGHLVGQDRLDAENKLNAQNQQAWADVYQQFITGSGEQVLDPNTGQLRAQDLPYMIAQGMTYEDFTTRIEFILNANGATPQGRHDLKIRADDLWRNAGGRMPGDPQDPLTADDKKGGGLPWYLTAAVPPIRGAMDVLRAGLAMKDTGENLGKRGEKPEQQQAYGGFGAAQPFGGKR